MFIGQNQLGYIRGRAIGWAMYYGAISDMILVSSKSAVENYESILKQGFEDESLMAKVNANLAEALTVEGNSPEKAESYAKESLQLSRKLKDKIGEANALRVLSKTERQQWKIDSAKSNLGNALSIVRSLKYKYDEGVMYAEFGTLALEVEDYKASKDYLERALALVEQRDVFKLNQASVLMQFGFALAHLGEFERSEKVIQYGQEITKTIGYRRVEYLCIAYQGLAASYQGNHQLAINLLTQAQDNLGDLQFANDQAVVLVFLGNVYLRLAFYEKAVELASKAYTLNKKDLSTLFLRIRANIKLKNYERASQDILTAESTEHQNPFINLLKGKLLLFQGSYQAAYESLQKFRNFSIINPFVHFYLGLVLIALGQRESSIEIIRKGLAVTYLAIDIDEILGEIKELQSEKKEFSDMVDVIEIIRSWQPKNNPN